MTYTLNPEREAYLGARGNVVLNACPGSGKTTSVAQKLVILQKDWVQRFGYWRGIACLSFTNVAKEEIAQTFRKESGFSLSYPHLISTIDSFVNQSITLPFAHRVVQTARRFRIVDDIDFLEKFFSKRGDLIKKFGRLFFRYSPSKIDYTITGDLCWDGHVLAQERNLPEFCLAAKMAQLKAGLLKTSDSAYFAIQVLRKNPRIATFIACRYPYIIVDEAQDTSEIQYCILDLLQQGGLTNIELVGDPYQCLYEWRDASPGLFLQRCERPGWTTLTLTENLRSTQKIVDVFSPLRRTGEKPIGARHSSSEDLPLHIMKYGDNSCASIVSRNLDLCRKFNLKTNRILVRGNALKNELLGTPKEIKPWNSPLPYQLVRALLHRDSGEVREAVETLRRTVLWVIKPDSDYDTIRQTEEELGSDHEFHGNLFELLKGFPSFQLSVAAWTTDAQEYLGEKLALEEPPDFEMRKRNSKNFRTELVNQPMHTIFKSYAYSAKSPVMTVHQAKGMTFDSVLLILSKDSKGQDIFLKDYQSPENLPSEKQRIIYVAMSRPRTLLCIGVPDSTTVEELHTCFGERISTI